MVNGVISDPREVLAAMLNDVGEMEIGYAAGAAPLIVKRAALQSIEFVIVMAAVFTPGVFAVEYSSAVVVVELTSRSVYPEPTVKAPAFSEVATTESKNSLFCVVALGVDTDGTTLVPSVSTPSAT